jgi:hypothetical protein
LTGDILPILLDANNHCIAEGQKVLCKRGKIKIENVIESDLVWTRGGWRKVLFSGLTDINRKTMVVKTTLGRVICTPDHEIWTTKGFVRADALRYNDEILNIKESSWSRLWSGTAKLIADTLKVIVRQIESITKEVLLEERHSFIERSGSFTTGQSQADSMSIIRTETQETMTSQTLNALHPKNIYQIGINSTRSEKPKQKECLIKSDHSARHGIQAKRELSSTKKSELFHIKNLFRLTKIANIATGFSSQGKLATQTSFVWRRVNLRRAGKVALTWFLLRVFSAEAFFRDQSIPTPKLVVGRVRTITVGKKVNRVYDLTIEEHHEFVVGGVLVSNCIDAIRYGLEPVIKPAKLIMEWA